MTRAEKDLLVASLGEEVTALDQASNTLERTGYKVPEAYRRVQSKARSFLMIARDIVTED